MSYVFPPRAAVSVPTMTGQAFPVHRIYCVGQNYEAHAREMSDQSGRQRSAPFFFMKPADAVFPVTSGECAHWPYPSQTNDLHHEIELVVALGTDVIKGSRMAVADAATTIWGYAVGLDMTRRDQQTEAKKRGQPWDMAKGFDCSAPISPIQPVQRVSGLSGGLEMAELQLSVNGVVRQQGIVRDMIWSVAEIISSLSTYVDLKAGDLIFTGTPAGVGAVSIGDVLEAKISGVGELLLSIVENRRA